MDELNEILKQALAIARANPPQALHLFEEGLEKARKSGNRHGLSILARHAGLVAAEAGDLLGAAKYYDEALSAQPEDAYLHFAKGDVCRTLGQDEQIRLAVMRCLQLATEQGDADMIELASEARARLDDGMN
jgi:tetratricopeptide (TPR) repeat protein